MDDTEARVRCLELATTLSARSGNYAPASIVEIATVLYGFTQASPLPETVEDIADKPKPGRKPKKVDDLMA